MERMALPRHASRAPEICLCLACASAHPLHALGNSLQGHTNTVYCVAGLPDEIRCATGASRSRPAPALTAPAQPAALRGQPPGVASTDSASPVSPLVLFAGSADNSVAIWSIATGACLAQLNGHLSTVYAIAVLPSGASTDPALPFAPPWNTALPHVTRLICPVCCASQGGLPRRARTALSAFGSTKLGSARCASRVGADGCTSLVGAQPALTACCDIGAGARAL